MRPCSGIVFWTLTEPRASARRADATSRKGESEILRPRDSSPANRGNHWAYQEGRGPVGRSDKDITRDLQPKGKGQGKTGHRQHILRDEPPSLCAQACMHLCARTCPDVDVFVSAVQLVLALALLDTLGSRAFCVAEPMRYLSCHLAEKHSTDRTRRKQQYELFLTAMRAWALGLSFFNEPIWRIIHVREQLQTLRCLLSPLFFFLCPV